MTVVIVLSISLCHCAEPKSNRNFERSFLKNSSSVFEVVLYRETLSKQY